MEILVVGAGIGGLTLALSLHQAGIACRVFEAAPGFRPLGVGINLLPHAMRELTELGLGERLAALAVETGEVRYYNRFGQLIYSEPRGRHAGYEWPQLSMHRADVHQVLLQAVRERIGDHAVQGGHRCTGFEQDAAGVTLAFVDGQSGAPLPPQRGAAAVGCDGFHSTLRRQLHPDEGPPAWEGINMWRGVTRMRPFLSGASMVVAGWLEVGKLVAYPIRDRIDAEGRQLVNWVAEIQSPRQAMQDWNVAGRLEDFLPAFEQRRYDWLDCGELLRSSECVLEYPMVDREPLERWGAGRVTLLGDAAHPMYPRGSNGAGQAILDARALAGCLRRERDREVSAALAAYEAARLGPANRVVLMNRSDPPDALLREVHRRTGDRPFARLEDVISRAEMEALQDNYKRVAGFERAALSARAPLA